MVIGLVTPGGSTTPVAVPLQLSNTSATSYGMALSTPQVSVPAGGADGSYEALALDGSAAGVTVAGAAFTHGGASATLAYDTPVIGVAQSSGAISGNLIYGNGLYGFISAPGATPPAFELGLQQ
jgi:feruloyl esterase